MFILAQGGATYARIRFSAGPGGEIELPVEVHYAYEFPGSNFVAWNEEYLACVNNGAAGIRPPEDPVAGDPIWGFEGFEPFDLEEQLIEPPF